MWFGSYPQINFCHFFSAFGTFEVRIVSKFIHIYWVPCVRNSSNSFIPIFLKLYRCFCHGLKMCIWFGYNPQINFCHFFPHFELTHFAVLNTVKVYG